MQTLANLFAGMLMAVLILAGLFSFAAGASEPEKRGSLAVAGAVLLGATMITLAIMNRNGDGDRSPD